MRDRTQARSLPSPAPRILATILLIFGGAILAAGCEGGFAKYASCKTDDDCSGRRDGGKLVCDNLRCVECHYDDDCGEGMHCSGKKTCESVSTRTPEVELPAPKSLEECAKRCKGDPSCGDSCRERFK